MVEPIPNEGLSKRGNNLRKVRVSNLAERGDTGPLPAQASIFECRRAPGRPKS